MERCPVCRARRNDDPVCHRCGTDLSWVCRVEAQAQTWQRVAIAKLLTDEHQLVREALQHAVKLKRAPLTLALLGMLDAELR